MGLPWVRLDTQWSTNPKFLTLIEEKKWRAICVYMAGLGYSGVHELEGFVPAVALATLHGTERDADDLAEMGLWNPDQAGWKINDWAEFQPSSAETEERSRKAREAAQIRWAKHRERKRPRAI